MNNVIIGTAGHIDHGKTTLIKALTGRETDRLKEEQKRGISIDLGFTYFDLPNGKRVGIVDVPGHEKFIKNMLAGAAGLDIVLLVISAEEGVMPQTIEHLDILSYLNVKRGLVVLTKCDCVDSELLEMVEEEVEDKLKNTFLKDAEIIEVDSISRRGIDELINKISHISDKMEDKNIASPARLNIDRVFSVKGFGTVITGTLFEGNIKVDDDLVVYPKDLKCKIRSIQVHGNNVKEADAGQRTAINISNIKVSDINRGDVLASPNSLEESMMLDVKMSIVKHTNKELNYWDRLKLYHGTREILCRAVPLTLDKIEPGESDFVQLRLEKSIVCKKGDKFVVRRYSPMVTIGGGEIIDASPKKHKRFDREVVEALKIKEKGGLKDILEENLRCSEKKYSTLKELMSYSGDGKKEIEVALGKLVDEQRVVNINGMYMYIDKYHDIKLKIENILKNYHKNFELRQGVNKEELRSKVINDFKTRDMDVLLERLSCENVVKLNGSIVSLKDFEVVLNKKQKEISNKILNALKNCGFSKILTQDDICNSNKDYLEVLESMVGQEVEKLDETYYMDKFIYEEAKKMLVDYILKNGKITLGEYRDLIDSSRKNCMIILENFDRCRLTKRIDNKRVLF